MTTKTNGVAVATPEVLSPEEAKAAHGVFRAILRGELRSAQDQLRTAHGTQAWAKLKRMCGAEGLKP